jgi:hypothetical protein
VTTGKCRTVVRAPITRSENENGAGDGESKRDIEAPKEKRRVKMPATKCIDAIERMVDPLINLLIHFVCWFGATAELPDR